MRRAVIQLKELGPLPSYKSVLADPNGKALVDKYQGLIESIMPPVTDAEARVLVETFGLDERFELEWRLIRLIETAPNWPLGDCLVNSGNDWVTLLKQRVENAGRSR
jgi:hypothetical protein